MIREKPEYLKIFFRNETFSCTRNIDRVHENQCRSVIWAEKPVISLKVFFHASPEKGFVCVKLWTNEFNFVLHLKKLSCLLGLDGVVEVYIFSNTDSGG